MKSSCSNNKKHLFIICNGLFMIFGIVLIATSCADTSKVQSLVSIETGLETNAALIAVGVLVIIVAAFGCFGAWKESPKLLYIYAGLLVVMILLGLSVGIAAAVLRPQLKESMKENLRETFIIIKYRREEDSYHQILWDYIQSNFQCCGITGPENYRDERLSHLAHNPTYSCCPPDHSDEATEIKYANCISNYLYYKEGCEDKVLTAIHRGSVAVIVCGILFCFLEIPGIVLALKLVREFKM